MESKFQVGTRVKDVSGAEDDGKVGTIKSEIIWIGYGGKPISRPKDAPKWSVVFDGETEQKPKREDELEIL